MMMHLDEGTTHKKKSLMILSAQIVCGQGSRRAPGHNFLGSTYLSRFLFSVLLGRTYARQKKVLYDLLDAWATDLTECYQDGIRINDQDTIWPVILSCKGDWPAVAKAGRLQRNFMRDAPSSGSPPGICHLCRAGMLGYPWNSFEANAAWLHADSPIPWTTPSPLAKIPQDSSNPASFYAVDLFHVCHKGVVADYAALVDADLVGDAPGGFEKRLASFYEGAKAWCTAHGKYLHMTNLTKDLLGLDTIGADYPVGRWFKGADTALLSEYLEDKYRVILADLENEELEEDFRIIYDGLVAINTFMSSIYHQPLWLQPTDAARIAQQGMLFMRAFNCAASRALEKSVPRFKVMDQVSLNALAYACQLDEDFVGRVS
ncbi:unnamed protein product, partial [Symbiodinium pilosum]